MLRWSPHQVTEPAASFEDTAKVPVVSLPQRNFVLGDQSLPSPPQTPRLCAVPKHSDDPTPHDRCETSVDYAALHPQRGCCQQEGSLAHEWRRPMSPYEFLPLGFRRIRHMPPRLQRGQRSRLGSSSPDERAVVTCPSKHNPHSPRSPRSLGGPRSTRSPRSPRSPRGPRKACSRKQGVHLSSVPEASLHTGLTSGTFAAQSPGRDGEGHLAQRLASKEWNLARTVWTELPQELPDLLEKTERVQRMFRWMQIRGKHAKLQDEIDFVRQLRRLFDVLDQDQNGKIEAQELEIPLKLLGVWRDASVVEDFMRQHGR